jgi:hypothetical protein
MVWHEGDGSLVWMPDGFFEALLLESLMDESYMTSQDDDWRELSL